MNHSTAQRLRRIGANLAALAVGAVAARATWEHISHVGAKYGESMAAWLPVSIDGMMVAGVILAADAKATGRKINPWARVATWLGGVMSIAAQIESGRERGIPGAIIATVFSVTLIITVEALFWRTKDKPAVEQTHPVEAVLAAPTPAPTSPPPAGRRTARHTQPVEPRRRITAKVMPEKRTIGSEPVSPLTGRPMKV